MGAAINRRNLLAQGSWVACGQILAALGALVGIRVLTELVPPTIYGALTLLLGIAALGLEAVFTPILQAGLRFYADCARDGVPRLRAILHRILLRRYMAALVIAILAWPIVSYLSHAPWTWIFLVLLLLLVDGLRSLETVLLNAARRQLALAVLSIADSWGKPLGAVVAIIVLGSSAESVLAGYLVATALILSVFRLFGQPEGRDSSPATMAPDTGLSVSMERYSYPLIPTAVVGWISGMGDRYVIGGLLGVEQLGIYAAIYGLLSRPFLLASRIVEMTLRPIYNELVATGNHDRADRLLWKWVGLVLAVSVVGFLVVLLFGGPLASLFLAEDYHRGFPLMPWIAGGYVLLVVSYVFEKVCFAYKRTAMLLLIESIGAVSSILIGVLFILKWGLLGAAMAVPAYFGVHLIASVLAARASEYRELRAPASQGTKLGVAT